MHAVIVDGDVSYPPTSGKRLRTLNLMLRLAANHRITYVCRCQANSAEARQAREYLGDHQITTVLVDHPVAPKRGALFYARLAGNLLSPMPYSVTSHRSQAMREAVQAVAARQGVDLWQFEWTGYLYTAAGLTGANKLVIAHNVDSLIWERYFENEKSGARRWYIGQQWHKMRHFERRAFQMATRVVAVSAEDARLVREEFGQPCVDVVENGIDRNFFAEVRRQPEPRRILFLGALDWRPNQDAVAWLLDDLMPRVLAQEPTAELCIVGRHPSPSLLERLRALPAVKLHADVPDVRPFLGNSAVMAVPLRIGGGSRLKILEALASGLPVISTTIGAEGLALGDGEEITLADTAESLAGALVQAIRNPAEQARLAENGRRAVLEQYDWELLARKLEASWERCVAGSIEDISGRASRRQPDVESEHAASTLPTSG